MSLGRLDATYRERSARVKAWLLSRGYTNSRRLADRAAGWFVDTYPEGTDPAVLHNWRPLCQVGVCRQFGNEAVEQHKRWLESLNEPSTPTDPPPPAMKRSPGISAIDEHGDEMRVCPHDGTVVVCFFNRGSETGSLMDASVELWPEQAVAIGHALIVAGESKMGGSA